MNARHQTEEALRDSEERLRLALESAGLGTWDCDLQTSEITGDDRTREIFGLSANRVPLKEFLLAIHPDDRNQLNFAARDARNSQSPAHHQLEVRALQPDGGVRWVAINGKVQLEGQEPNRHPARCIGTVLDITERKCAEEALSAAHARTETILGSITDAFFALDRQWQFAYVNSDLNSIGYHRTQMRRGSTECGSRPHGNHFGQHHRRLFRFGPAVAICVRECRSEQYWISPNANAPRKH